MSSPYDEHLALYRQYTVEVWCSNPHCTVHEDGETVLYASEYGQGWLEPEECPLCGGEWLEDRPAPVAPWDPELSDAENEA